MPAVEPERTSLLLCCDGDNVAVDIEQRAAKLANSNKIFYNNLTLALAMAAWVTIFGLPVYSTHCEWLLFGNKERCGPNKMGLKANVGTEDDPIIVNMNATLAADGVKPYAWCGFLPGAYFTAWPAVVQTMIFTVFLSTGSTVRLAWQGLAGTFIAVVNIWIMDYLFSDMKTHTGGATSKGYHGYIGWANLVGVLFLFLATKADTNTMMYGMSWTVCFMLHFMNPETGSVMGTYQSAIPGINFDAETTVALLTAFGGCFLAVAATIFPKPLLNIRNVHSDAEEITKGINEIFQQAIEYWEGDASGPKRFAVYAKMSDLVKAIARVRTNLKDAYWETFDLCGYGKIRRLYTLFVEAVDRNSDEVYLLKAATGSLNFEGEGGSMHQAIVQGVKKELMYVKNAAVGCLRCCAKACKDGQISEEERQEIKAAVDKVKQGQQDLSNQFQIATKGFAPVDERGAADQLFIFSISQWAQECADFATDLSKFEESYVSSSYGNSCCNFIVMLAQELASTLDPRAAFTLDQLRYVAVNMGPILLTFAMATHFNGSVFVPYSSTMPSLLALMVSSAHGIPFIKNAQRLVGIVFGHTMPLLAMSVITMLDCDSHFRFLLHMSSIFVFFFCFTFMYYASAQWSGLGCAIAGFGVYPLFAPCSDNFTPHFGGHYKDIAQVIIAMILKMGFENVLMKSEPRDDALKLLEELNADVIKAFDAFFKGEIRGTAERPGLKELRDKVKEQLAKCEAILPATDPSLAIVPGSRLPFKSTLLDAGLKQFRLVLSDLDMLVLAVTGHEVTHAAAEEGEAPKEETTSNNAQATEHKLFSLMQQQPSFNKVKDDVMETVSVITGLLYTILSHDTEGPLKSNRATELQDMSKVHKLDGMDVFCTEVSTELKKEIDARSQSDIVADRRVITELKRTRLTVALHALALTVEHVADMSAQCFEHMTF